MNEELFFQATFSHDIQDTVIPKDYWDEKNFQDMRPLSVNSIHIRGLLFEKKKWAFFSTDQLVVLPYKAKCHLRGKISKGSTFLSY